MPSAKLVWLATTMTRPVGEVRVGDGPAGELEAADRGDDGAEEAGGEGVEERGAEAGALPCGGLQAGRHAPECGPGPGWRA